MKEINIAFPHGLGDCANYARALRLWIDRGFSVNVVCAPDKACLFHAAGCTTENRTHASEHPFLHAPTSIRPTRMVGDWMGNKVAANLTRFPMPYIGHVAELWDEVKLTRCRLPRPDGDAPAIPGEPTILLHTRGTTNPHKNFKLGTEAETISLLNKIGRVLVLDFQLPLPQLCWLMERASLIVGVDSGILHLASWTDTPALGCWYGGHMPRQYHIPREETCHLIEPTPQAIADKARIMLACM